MRARELVERFAGNDTDDVSQQEEVDVGVDDALVRTRHGHFVDGLADRRVVAIPLGIELEVGPQARRVREQVPDGDVALAVLLEAGHVQGDAVGQPQLALLHQHHDRRRRRDHLGERGGVEDRVGRHRLWRGLNGAPSDRRLPGDAGFGAHRHHRTGQFLAGDRGFDHLPDLAEARQDRSERHRPWLQTAGRRGRKGWWGEPLAARAWMAPA